MPTAFVTAEQVVAEMAAQMGQAESAVPPPAVHAKAVLAANYTNSRLRDLLTARGYSAAEAARWGSAGPTALTHAITVCLMYLATDAQQAETWRRQIKDIEQPLTDPAFALTDADGLLVRPATPAQGATASVGTLAAAAPTLDSIRPYPC